MGILVACALIFSLLSSLASAEVENFNTNEVTLLRQFLNLPSGISGKTNGQVLNSAYDQNDPFTWTGVSWSDTSIMRATGIGESGEWTGMSLAGALDLSDFAYLRTLYIAGNYITSLNTTGDTNLQYVNCTSNRMTGVRYDYNGGYANFTSDGNGYVGYQTDMKQKGEGKILIIYGEPEAKPGYYFDEWKNYGELMVDDSVVRLYANYNTYYPEVKALFVPDEDPYPSYPPTTSPTPPITPSLPPSPAVVNTNYIPIYYKVVFDPNGGTRTGGGELTQSVFEGGDAVLPVVEYANHNFVRWDSTNKVITSDRTIKAIWEDVYQVSFDLNGGMKTGGGDLIQSVATGGAAKAPEVERYGYTFQGWNKAFDKITENTVVAAIWDPNADEPESVTYRVIYEMNGGSQAAPVDTNEYRNGDIALVSDDAGFTKDGYEFLGWSYEPDGDVIIEEEITVSDDITLYAVWEEIPEAEPVISPTPVPPVEPTDAVQASEDIPKTGDSDGVLAGVLMLLFGSGIVTFEIIKKRRLKKQGE